MPSPTSTTVPTLRVSTPASNWSIDDLMMLVISSERMAIDVSRLLSQRVGGGQCQRRRGAPHSDGSGGELRPQPLEATPDAPVDESIADPDDDPADQVGIDRGLERDLTAGHLLETGGDRPDLGVVQRARARGDGVDDVVALVIEPAELRRDPRQLPDPAP